MTPAIFKKYERTAVVGDGRSVFDFLGGAILAEYKAGWTPLAEGKELTPGYPGANEWYIDWIACLVSAYLAKDAFRVVELGAGYAQWMVSSVQAFKALNPDGKAYGLALEADEVHYGWMLDHVKANFDAFTGVDTDLLHSAAGRDGTVSFPVLAEPSRNYGASVSKGAAVSSGHDYVTVPSESLRSIYARLGENLVDILHIDIQGAEVDLLLEADVTPELHCTKALMIGTIVPTMFISKCGIWWLHRVSKS